MSIDSKVARKGSVTGSFTESFGIILYAVELPMPVRLLAEKFSKIQRVAKESMCSWISSEGSI